LGSGDGRQTVTGQAAGGRVADSTPGLRALIGVIPCIAIAVIWLRSSTVPALRELRIDT